MHVETNVRFESVPADHDPLIDRPCRLDDEAPLFRTARPAGISWLRSGGAPTVQALNARRDADGPVIWEKSGRLADGAGQRWPIKGVHRLGSPVLVEVASWSRLGDEIRNSMRNAAFPVFEAEKPPSCLRSAGAEFINPRGNNGRRTYDGERIQDIISVGQ